YFFIILALPRITAPSTCPRITVPQNFPRPSASANAPRGNAGRTSGSLQSRRGPSAVLPGSGDEELLRELRRRAFRGERPFLPGPPLRRPRAILPRSRHGPARQPSCRRARGL